MNYPHGSGAQEAEWESERLAYIEKIESQKETMSLLRVENEVLAQDLEALFSRERFSS